MIFDTIFKRSDKFKWLVAASLSVLFFPSIFDEIWYVELSFLSCFTALVFISVYCISDSKRHLFIFGSMGISTLILPWLNVLFDLHEQIAFINLSTFAIFYIFMALKIIVHIMEEDNVNSDLLFGAIGGYLVLGYASSILNFIVFTQNPDAFNSTQNFNLMEFIYFSFVTLSTLGYGDMIPISNTARNVAVITAIAGQFYVAIVVAIIIGKYVSFRSQNRKVK